MFWNVYREAFKHFLRQPKLTILNFRRKIFCDMGHQDVLDQMSLVSHGMLSVNIYLFKLTIETLEEGVKYVQS